MKRCLRLLIALILLPATQLPAQEPKPRVPITPPWALECWLWEDDDSTAKAITELLDGYAEHDIPARTIIIDAPWSMRYNDFKIDEARYPNPKEFFADMKRRGVHVIAWMTPMVNSQNNDTGIKDSKDFFEEAKAKGYLAGGGHQQKWWHGLGGFIDYSNPEAMKWWRGMQQQILDLGIDGWKLDDSALYFNSGVGAVVGRVDMPSKEQRTGPGWMTTREYMDHFYRDEYQHGLQVRNGDFITLARSIDGRVHPEGFAPLDAAPVTWVGDQDHAWTAKEEGIEEALNYILEAARLGYCVIGSDVAGYHGPHIIPPNLYIRWAQMSCFNGLFLNGGHGERAMWKRTPQELEIIRKYAWLHNELVPYMYTHVVDCHNGGKPLMRPVGKSLKGVDQGSFHYYFGDDFLVAPIHEDSLTRTVNIPEGKWRPLFHDDQLIEGPTTITANFELEDFPVYIREGAIIPMQVSRPYTGIGDKDSEKYLTWNIYPAGSGKFTYHRTDGSGDTTAEVSAAEKLEVKVTGTKSPHILRIRMEAEPKEVTLDGKTLVKDAEWKYDGGTKTLIIKVMDYGEGTYVIST